MVEGQGDQEINRESSDENGQDIHTIALAGGCSRKPKSIFNLDVSVSGYFSLPFYFSLFTSSWTALIVTKRLTSPGNAIPSIVCSDPLVSIVPKCK